MRRTKKTTKTARAKPTRKGKPARAKRSGRVKSARVEPAGSGVGPLAWLTVVGARQNNLRDLIVEIPLARFVCVTGVSGSGKSSLVNDIVRETLARDLNGSTKARPGLHDRIDGLEHLDKVIDIDQSPIGRTPRSNPGTYIKVFDEIRTLFAKLPDSKVRGYKPGRFSFNVKTGSTGGGRCEACEGNGSNKMEMDFLADIWVTCPVCSGRRFSRETLQILYKGKSIADVMEMDVQEALDHFKPIHKIAAMLRTLHDVGMDYIKLGQSSTTLSGGEAQRIKLARELVKRSTGRTLYLLDEPTTGLHFDDIKKLLIVLHRFVDTGNSVIVIEHNLDVVKTADWVIDLGPEGGDAGGLVVASGTPEQVAQSKTSHTGVELRDALNIKGVKRITYPADSCGTGFQPVKRKYRKDYITVVGAKQHNLKDITVEVPRGRMTVACGPSGSGKSSFAIDTLYAEGQRRYVESLSAYARQFLSRLQPPRVDHVHGLSPSICIEQKTATKSPRSTVGTITEIYDYMRILWARIGQPHCPKCSVPIGTQTSDEIVEKVLELGTARRVLLLAPIEPTGQESYTQLLERERANGYARARVDGVVCSLDEPIELDERRVHDVELVVDRITSDRKHIGRITDSVEQALAVGNGVIIVQAVSEDADKMGGRHAGDAAPRELKSAARKETETPRGLKPAARDSEYRFSQHHSCDRCGLSYDELSPHHFSFNSRMGWCEACEGLGVQQGASASAIVVHPTRSIADGAIGGWGEIEPGSKLHVMISALADHIGFELHTEWNRLTETQRLAVLHGCGDEWISVHQKPRASSAGTKSARNRAFRSMRFRWRGFFPAIGRATRSSWRYRKRLEDLVTEVPCDACTGGRLSPEPAAVRIQNVTIHAACSLPLAKTLQWFQKLKLPPRERKIAGELLHEITSRLRFLVDVGLDYVTLHRRAGTLSGGESQRIQLASQIGTGLTGVLYVLDEPTIGLHPRDNGRLLLALKRLRDLGNSLLLVEHDREVIDSADHILDFGPGAGAYGGHITAEGTPKRIRSHRRSLTGRYLSGKESIAVPSNRRAVDKSISWLTVHGARENNLLEIDAAFPLGRFTCVTGVSGSGKSSLVSSILYPALAARLHRARLVPGGHDRISGLEHVDKIINVDQTPIGNSPTSNPATYTGVFDTIRQLFAKLPLSKIRGYTANRFSFNRPGGRCEVCEGMGKRCIEMHFLPDVWVDCEQCAGKRYVAETLEVCYHGKSIADVLEMSVTSALDLFQSVPRVLKMLQTLDDVGLGYIRIGQSAPTLSAGEAQRVKLAAELGRPSTGKTVYVLDEPTTGLHFDDLKKLLGVLHRLVDMGNTCICIEHNLDVVKTADWVIDLGPDAGEAGGTIVVEGTPETIAATKRSHTGAALKPILEDGPLADRPAYGAVPPKRARALKRTRESDPESILDLGEGVQMPWERDGRTWHTVDHLDGKGKPVHWDVGVLVWLVDAIESVGAGLFAPTDWSQRTRIEIKAPGAKQWFCHLLTGGSEMLDVTIRTPDATFATTAVRRALKIKTLDERTDLPIYGQGHRISRRALSAGWEEWRVHLRDFTDVSKAALRRFLKNAAAAYSQRLAETEAEPNLGQPWKTDGRQWHLSQMSISKRHAIRWKPTLVMALIGRFKSIQGDLVDEWDNQTAVHLCLPRQARWTAKIVTNLGRGLRVELRAPSGLLTPTRVDRLGLDTEIKPQEGYDRIIFWLRSLGECDTKQLREVWRVCASSSDIQELQSA